MSLAALIIDPQKDFCEGGSLEVIGGAQKVQDITRWVLNNLRKYSLIVVSRDWHINPGGHFASNVGFESDKMAPEEFGGSEAHFQAPQPDYIDTWPDHCVAFTQGAMFHNNLSIPFDDARVPTDIVSKGMWGPGYSAFDPGGIIETNQHRQVRSLDQYLHHRSIGKLDVMGIETNHCVKASAIDGVGHGYEVDVLLGLCAALSPEDEEQAVKEMEAAGINVIMGS